MKLLNENKKDSQKEIHFFLLFLHIHRIIYKRELRLIHLQKNPQNEKQSKTKIKKNKKVNISESIHNQS